MHYMIRDFRYELTAEATDKTITQYLHQMGYSHHIITSLKRTQAGICLNGIRAYASQRIRPGDILTIHLEEPESSPGIVPAPVPFDILYEDMDLLIVNKPADTPIHPSPGNFNNTLANGLACYFARQNVPYVYRCINRLDRDTTGLLILAKHGISGAILSDQMMKRRIIRTYHALAEGITPSEGTIDAPIARKGGSVIERCINYETGEQAVTHYRRLDTGQIDSASEKILYSRLELKLETGRTHQIRVHMQSIGHPLLGDTLYRPENPAEFSHQALHSYSLEFTHPITGAPMYFSVPEPW